MICLYCGAETKVSNSRHQKRNNQVWRRRQCLKCKAIFTTHEMIDLSSTLLVDTKNGPRPFISDLLFSDLLLALKDHKDRYIVARETTSSVINTVLSMATAPNITTKQISQASATVLKRIDKQAYLRFVSEHPSQQS